MDIYEKLILAILRKFKNGQLEIEMPTSRKILIGDVGPDDEKAMIATGAVKNSDNSRNSNNVLKQSSLSAVKPYNKRKKSMLKTIPSMTITDRRFFKRVALYGDIGFGEAYVNGWWHTDDVKEVLSFFIGNWPQFSTTAVYRKPYMLVINAFSVFIRFRHYLKRNTIKQAKKNIADHYDISNQFFQFILDKSMTYSSAFFKEAKFSLHQAQIAKYDRLCREAGISKGDHVLEIGSGWGGFAEFAASRYGCKVTSITISEEQFNYSTKRIKKTTLRNRVHYELIDYRKIKGAFDKIVSIEMIEAVGAQYLREFFLCCHRLLKPNGVFALQAIVCPDFKFASTKKGADWIQRYIFPGSFIPSIHALLDSVVNEETFFLYNLKDLGKDYARTLSLWCRNLKTNVKKLHQLGYDDSFIRKWEYYFKYCETGFETRYLSVVQMIFTRPGRPFLNQSLPRLASGS
ncbi:tuberculostearic acid methyltransferase UfaA1 [Spirochaetota bacterium]|nr:tuberculostearic acid methyltransferase UfaA1 [Spirochaetota bacterium]